MNQRFTTIVAVCALAFPAEGMAQQDQQLQYPVDLIIMPVSQSVRANFASPASILSSTTFTMQGVEGFLLGERSGFGIGGRHITGPASPTGRKSQNSDAYVLIGDKAFHFDAGYSVRTHSPTDTSYQFGRAGFSTTVYLGTSGVALRGRAAYYIPFKKHEPKGNGPEGWEGETSISYTWPRFPVFAQLGYRIERFKTRGWEEEVSALTLGAGIWLWGR